MQFETTLYLSQQALEDATNHWESPQFGELGVDFQWPCINSG
jgi:hypothetical protein